MDGRKRKRKKEHDETKESSRESTGRTAAGAHGGGDDDVTSEGASGTPPTGGNPRQNSPRSAAPVTDKPRGRTWTKAQLRAAALGMSAPREGAHSPGVQQKAQGSGITPPPATATASTAARAAGEHAPGVPPFRGNPGENSPRSAVPVTDKPRGRSWTKAQLRAAALGLSAPSDGAHSPGVQSQAQGSGIMPPPATATASTAARAAREHAPGAPPSRGNSGQISPRSPAPPPRSWTKAQLRAAALGLSAPSHGAHSAGVQGQAHRSGIMPPPATASTAATAAGEHASGAPPSRGNRGQNAPPSAAPVADEPPRGRSWTKAQLRAVALGLGESGPGDGVHSPQAQGSGTRSPPAMVCPVCHHSVFSNTICVNCACVEARKLVLATRPPPPPQRQQQRPQGLQGRLSPAYLEFVAGRLMGQPRGGAPPPPVPAISIPIPPQPQNQQRPPRPQQHPLAPPQPVATGVQLQHQRLRRMAAELAASRRSAAERGGAPGAGAPSAAQLGLLGVQRQPKAVHPVPRALRPVGFHYNPFVPGRGPDPEDGWCPACRFYPARTVLQPRRHDCVCQTCRDVDRIVCWVCGSK